MFFKRKAEMIDQAAALPGGPSPFHRRDPFRLRPRAQGPLSEGSRSIIFALGCYWGPSAPSGRCRGVWVTAVGNAGGFTPIPL